MPLGLKSLLEGCPGEVVLVLGGCCGGLTLEFLNRSADRFCLGLEPPPRCHHVRAGAPNAFKDDHLALVFGFDRLIRAW
ncbi:MAG TPA: hypothetical protein VF371_11825 [Candidatus Limnocylindrales bacterium]